MKPEPTVVKVADLASAAQPLTPMRPHVATKDNSQFVTGRRDWVRYLDAGIAEASGGRMRATITSVTGAMDTETGWHYHECEMQIAYLTSGWMDMQLEDGRQLRIEAGDVMFLPGGTKHNEIATSPDVGGIEITVPAAMGTIACDPPSAWRS